MVLRSNAQAPQPLLQPQMMLPVAEAADRLLMRVIAITLLCLGSLFTTLLVVILG